MTGERRFAGPGRLKPTAPVHPEIPTAGFYRMKLRRGAAWVPVRIWFGPSLDPDTGAEREDRPWLWHAEVNGEVGDPWETGAWPYCAGEPIPEADYRFLRDRNEWSRRYDAGSPEANPRRRVDLSKLPPVF